MKTNTKKSLLALFLAATMAIPMAFAVGEPENVAGVSANATGPASVNVSWNSAKTASGGLVDHYRVYYGTKSVQSGEAPEYESEVNTPNNNTSFLFSDLLPTTTYYFSVTAVDASGVESVEYSVETNATTPAGQSADTVPPIVMSAVALDKTHVNVRFSEKVKLPALLPEAAFSINEQINPSNQLNVTAAEIYTGDPSEKYVLLETSEQIKNMNYVVTASVVITDIAGNPIVSGSTDSGLFAGSDKVSTIVMGQAPATEEETSDEEATAEETADTPNMGPLVNAEAVNCGLVNTDSPGEDAGVITGCFEAKFQTCSPAVYIKNTGAGINLTSYQYEILGPGVTGCQVQTQYVSHTQSEWLQKTMTCEYDNQKTVVESEKEVIDSFAQDQKKGNCVGDLYALMLQSVSQSSVLDVTPPEDITGLILTFKRQVDTFVVMMNWTASLNTAKDLIDQILYQSMDRGTTYDAGKSLGSGATSGNVAGLEGGKEYTFKITTKDASGNESVGVVKSIRLPQTGIGAGLLLLGSALGAREALRRKRRNR